MTTERLQNEEEILFRQIHPNFYENGHPSSSPFVPSAKDGNQMSVDRSSLTTAAGSFDLYTGNGYQSVAVFGVTVGECGVCGLPCHPDPLGATETRKANPAHAYVDYSAIGSNAGKKIAKRLRNDAVKRGRLHPPLCSR
jgi:hypothetical protein